MNNIMTPDHPRWNEFASRLGGPDGCDFKEDEKGNLTWKCKGGHDQTYSRKILSEMGGIDVEQSLIFFTKNGGHCDCEVLFNIDPGTDD